MLRRLLDLDDRKMEAAMAPDVPSVVMGASTEERSTVLLARALILLSRGVRPEEVAMITPHDHHALVLRKRLGGLLQRYEDQQLLIDTEAGGRDGLRGILLLAAHLKVVTPAQYATSLLRQSETTSFSVWSKEDELEVLSSLLNSLRGGAGFAKGRIPREIHRFYDWHVRNLELPKASPRLPVSQADWMTLEQMYQAEMTACRAMGLHQLMKRAMDVLEEAKAANAESFPAEALRHRHFLVDHLEDVTRSEFLLLERLARRTRSITVSVNQEEPWDATGRWTRVEVFETYFPHADTWELQSTQPDGPPTSAAVRRIAEYRRFGRIAFSPPHEFSGTGGVEARGVTCVALWGWPRLEMAYLRQLLWDRLYLQREILIVCTERSQVNRTSSMLSSWNVGHHVETAATRVLRKQGTRNEQAVRRGAWGLVEILACVANPYDPRAFVSAATTASGPNAIPRGSKALIDIQALARERNTDLLGAARIYTQPMDPRRKEYRILRPFVEECLTLTTFLHEGRPDVLDRMIEQSDQILASTRGHPPTQIYTRQRDDLLRMARGYETFGAESSRQVLLRFLDDLSPVLHPNCDLLEDPGAVLPRITLTTAEASVGRVWNAVILVTGQEFIGGGEGLKNLQRAAAAARDMLLILVPPLRTAGRNKLNIRLLELIFGDACPVQKIGVQDVKNAET